jgi:putative ABC transport system ATP-binding protein
MEANGPIVSLKGVDKGWWADGRYLPVLHEVDIEVRPGESLAIVGPSGTGKSTLLHIIGMLTPINKGEVWWDDTRIDDNDLWWDTSLRRQMAIVFQDGKLLPNLRVVDNVCVPLAHRGVRHRRQRELAIKELEGVGLGERLRHYPNQLSGGEHMRAALARALVTAPRLILADEPTGTLDSATGEMITKLLFGAVTEHRALVVVTHHMPLAERADRVVVMQDGRIVERRPGRARNA